MRHGAAPHSTRRAAREGGLALIVRHGLGSDGRSAVDAPVAVAVGVASVPASRSGTPPGPATASTGQHRPRSARRRAPSEPQRTLQLLMSSLGALIVLGICGLSGFFVVADERRGHSAQAAERTVEPDRISSRRLDDQPLTLQEVFPEARIRLVPGAAPYSVGTTHIDTDCGIATTGRLDSVLADHDCSQVVRASMTAPYGGYLVTAGLFNLAEAADAAQVGEQARYLVESGGGTFAAMSGGGPGTDPLDQPPAQVGWHEHGHYLVYCVISRPDGQVVTDEDAYARRITADLVESYLGAEVLDRRASST